MQYFEIDIAVKCVLIALIEKYALYFHNPRSMNVCGLEFVIFLQRLLLVLLENRGAVTYDIIVMVIAIDAAVKPWLAHCLYRFWLCVIIWAVKLFVLFFVAV